MKPLIILLSFIAAATLLGCDKQPSGGGAGGSGSGGAAAPSEDDGVTSDENDAFKEPQEAGSESENATPATARRARSDAPKLDGRGAESKPAVLDAITKEKAAPPKPVVKISGDQVTIGPFVLKIPGNWTRTSSAARQQLVCWQLPAGDAAGGMGPQFAVYAREASSGDLLVERALNRWAGQFDDGPPGEVLQKAKCERFESGGVKGVTFDFTGAYRGGEQARQSGAEAKAGQRMIAAMFISGQDAIHVRVLAPADALAANAEAVMGVIRGVKAADK